MARPFILIFTKIERSGFSYNLIVIFEHMNAGETRFRENKTKKFDYLETELCSFTEYTINTYISVDLSRSIAIIAIPLKK